MRKFMWRRIVLDKETNKVANSNLRGLDPNWEDKEVVWQIVKENTIIGQEEVEDLFGTAVEAEPVIDST
jgi:hypothetical protein